MAVYCSAADRPIETMTNLPQTGNLECNSNPFFAADCLNEHTNQWTIRHDLETVYLKIMLLLRVLVLTDHLKWHPNRLQTVL